MSVCIIWHYSDKECLLFGYQKRRELDYGLHRHIVPVSTSKDRFEMLLFNIALIVTSVFQDLMLLIYFFFLSVVAYVRFRPNLVYLCKNITALACRMYVGFHKAIALNVDDQNLSLKCFRG